MWLGYEPQLLYKWNYFQLARVCPMQHVEVILKLREFKNIVASDNHPCI